MTIGQRIKVRREELNMSQEELAKRIGYKSRSSINKIELDLYSLQQSKIKAIADALDTTPSYIMGWDEEASRNEWASKFRDSVMQILNNADPADLEAAGISVPVRRGMGHSCQKSCSCGQPQEVHAGAHHLDGRGNAGGSGQRGE